MYCILVTGIPAAGKTTMAEYLSRNFSLPVISKDKIKEIMFDEIGFGSRQEKVKLGTASMEIMYYFAEQFMKCNQPFILENNFENASREGLMAILEKYAYEAITITLTGDYEVIYKRFMERNASPQRHRGHVVNQCYPEKEEGGEVPAISYEGFVSGIISRGMDRFTANGPKLVLDTTDFQQLDKEEVLKKVAALIAI